MITMISIQKSLPPNISAGSVGIELGGWVEKMGIFAYYQHIVGGLEKTKTLLTLYMNGPLPTLRWK